MLVASLSCPIQTILTSRNPGIPHLAHTKLQCDAKKLLRRPSSVRRGRTSNRITCNSPNSIAINSPRMKIIRRCELLASLLDHVAKALWDFNGMNVKGDFAVVCVKDIRECRLGPANSTTRLAKHVLYWCLTKKSCL